jgi:hypothetical protein
MYRPQNESEAVTAAGYQRKEGASIGGRAFPMFGILLTFPLSEGHLLAGSVLLLLAIFRQREQWAAAIVRVVEPLKNLGMLA